MCDRYEYDPKDIEKLGKTFVFPTTWNLALGTPLQLFASFWHITWLDGLISDICVRGFGCRGYLPESTRRLVIHCVNQFT